jgi:hypothetical protein
LSGKLINTQLYLSKGNHMRLTHLLTSLFVVGFIFTGAAMAADEAPASASSKLEAISAAPATESNNEDKCPMHKGKKNCKEKHGEPCPYHDKDHHGKSHEKCEHEHRI